MPIVYMIQGADGKWSEYQDKEKAANLKHWREIQEALWAVSKGWA